MKLSLPASRFALAALLAAAPARAGSILPEMEAVSASFLGRPYELGPLGEGTAAMDPRGLPEGRFDSQPLADLERFDCTTFVEQVLAKAGARAAGEGPEAEARRLARIRYKDGRVSYVSRNHFTEADWLPYETAAGFLRDATDRVARAAGFRASVARKRVSKRAWYAAKTAAELQGPLAAAMTPAQRESLAEEWRGLGRDLPDQDASIAYIPLARLEEALRGPAAPSGTVVSVVRADRVDKPTIVSHQGLLIRQGARVLLRHAKPRAGVVDEDLFAYFAGQGQWTWPVVGLNLAVPR